MRRKPISVGYLTPRKKHFISDVVISNNFLELFGRYLKVKIIPVNKNSDIKRTFKQLKKHRLDYLYVDVYNFLLESFLLRERFHVDIPFILTVHTVFPWINKYISLVPLIRKYDVIYAVSEYARKSFLRVSDRFKVHIIANCLDLSFIRKNVFPNLKKDRKIITFMGRLTKEKGIEPLIRCMPEIIARVNNVYLNIIGPLSGGGIKDSPKSKYVKKLERMVRQLRLTNRVHFRGVRLGLDKYRLLSESDIFVSPTTAPEEAFPVANIEALACAVPVITTNWAGNKELIRDGKNGFLIDINYGQDKKPKINTRQLISVIVKILKNRQLGHKMKRNSLTVAQRYDYRRVLPRLVCLLKKTPLGRSKERWSLIKDKTIADFRSSFNKDFFFFVNFDRHFRKKTYATLYKEVLPASSFKRKRLSRARKRTLRRRTRDLAILKRLRQDFIHFLLLRSN